MLFVCLFMVSWYDMLGGVTVYVLHRKIMLCILHNFSLKIFFTKANLILKNVFFKIKICEVCSVVLFLEHSTLCRMMKHSTVSVYTDTCLIGFFRFPSPTYPPHIRYYFVKITHTCPRLPPFIFYQPPFFLV